jgi:hypothetical protein
MQTKFNIGDTVYAFVNDRIVYGKIEYMSIGEAGVTATIFGYRDDTGEYFRDRALEGKKENELFSTKEECLNAMICENSARALLLSKLREKAAASG